MEKNHLVDHGEVKITMPYFEYDHILWDYCYNSAYIILGNDKAKLMLDALKASGGPKGFASGSEEDFRFMMTDAIKKDESIKPIVDEYVSGVIEHNKKVRKEKKRSRK